MGYNITDKDQGTPVPKSLSEHSISHNNITLTYDGKQIKVETRGEWSGDWEDFSTLVTMLIDGQENAD